MSIKVYGDITRELYEAWQGFVGESTIIPSVQMLKLFHLLGLFPSRSQVHEMLHCASDCSNRPTADHLTFGEFCVFCMELKTSYENQTVRPTPLSKLPDRFGNSRKAMERQISKSSMKCDVFLGGSCNPTTWRQDIAIPLLKSLGITYYNPQVPHWGPELIELENQAKQASEILFFVIDNQTRSVASMIEAAHISGCQRKLILVIKDYEKAGRLLGEAISDKEYQDLRHGQAILQDLVERQDIPVFDDVLIALRCTAKVLQEGRHPNSLGLDDQAQPVHMAHIQLGDKLVKLREAFDALDTSNAGLLGLADVCMAFRVLTNRDLTMDDLQAIMSQHSKKTGNSEEVTFDQFCCIVTEFKNKYLDSKMLLRSMVMRTSKVFHTLMSPFTKVLGFCVLCIIPSSSGEFLDFYDIPLREWLVPRRRLHLMSNQRDVFLGGSCGGDPWREELAIPLLKKSGLTYFNPQVTRWSERFIPIEATAMENCRILLFVITNDSRSLAAMAVASHYIGLGCNMVLCIQYLKDSSIIAGEQLSKQAVRDYNRGRMYLSDLANREGVPVFEDIEEALDCIIQKCKNKI